MKAEATYNTQYKYNKWLKYTAWHILVISSKTIYYQTNLSVQSSTTEKKNKKKLKIEVCDWRNT
jgi:hypothetical protein